MKTGYSNLLGEYVAATDLQHADTVAFQVVCPHCREAVFKVERQDSHFLSHHHAFPGSDECELRVAALPHDRVAQTNAASRGQTLKLFLSVFRDAVNLAWNEPGAQDESAWIIPRLEHSDLVVHNAIVEGNYSDTPWDYLDDELDKLIDEMRTTLPDVGRLGWTFQKRTMLDLRKHLQSAHAHKNRKFMGMHGLKRIAQSLSDTDRQIVELLLLNAPRETTAGLQRLGKPDDDGFNPVGDFYYRLGRIEDADILRIPFHAMISNHQRHRPLLEGIDMLLPPIPKILRHDEPAPPKAFRL